MKSGIINSILNKMPFLLGLIDCRIVWIKEAILSTPFSVQFWIKALPMKASLAVLFKMRC
jgi:hypothetical protein